jgi:tRNA(fMet)-specific endonuclease VapC
VIDQQVLLDTDTVSLLLRNQPHVSKQAREYSATRGKLFISIITRFEIIRGLKVKDGSAQLARFERFCARNEVLPLTEAIVMRAADIYADLYRRGTLIGDADILIAATALVHDLVIITNNEAHFRRITGLHVDNWLT